MKTKTFFLIACSVALTWTTKVNAQCNITATGSPTLICLNDCVTLSSTGDCTDYLMYNDFDNQTIGTGWISQCNPQFNNPCSPGNGTPHLWVGSTVSYPREITTIPYSVTAQCQICFDMMYATQGQSAPCEGPDLPGEGVHLQYSVNGGVTWIDINYWPPNGGYDPQMTSWNNYCENVPAAATSFV